MAQSALLKVYEYVDSVRSTCSAEQAVTDPHADRSVLRVRNVIAATQSIRRQL
ncbi:hypothetical protein A8926_4224 [Saccharopolyspora spinosa]|uniref:Uncharacterized protein n=1 Tax=Saccharopolyspora spinosa TaxID=60894 RepID=A0A2N3Y0G3_SACSN|nr:hypothetical protein A8926_4224 [Saccharopolyspora spinosa]